MTISFTEQLADQHEAQIKRTLKDLEARIISDISKAVNEKDIISTQIAIQLRPNLKRYIEEEYLTVADSNVREYDRIVASFMEEFGELDIPDEFKSLTQVDADTITQLKVQSFSGYEEIANRYLTEISKNVYQNAIAGRKFDDIVKDISGLITGDVDRRGRTMSGYASQIAHDSLFQFDRQFTVHKAKEAGIDRFKYQGTKIRDSRPFCVREVNRANAGVTYTKEEIQKLHDNRAGQYAKGKAEGDPFIVAGGYRCRHSWLPVIDI